jgi:hypothetical protein
LILVVIFMGVFFLTSFAGQKKPRRWAGSSGRSKR